MDIIIILLLINDYIINITTITFYCIITIFIIIEYYRN